MLDRPAPQQASLAGEPAPGVGVQPRRAHRLCCCKGSCAACMPMCLCRAPLQRLLARWRSEPSTQCWRQAVLVPVAAEGRRSTSLGASTCSVHPKADRLAWGGLAVSGMHGWKSQHLTSAPCGVQGG